MSKILVTGTSGCVGKALAGTLAKEHDIVCFSRKATDLNLPSIEADFSDNAQLSSLDKYDISAVVPDESGLELSDSTVSGEWRCGRITKMVLSDAVRAFSLAAESKLKSGVRILNTCGPESFANEPTSAVSRAWFGPDIDVSYFEKPGNEFSSVYDPSAIAREIGFVARVLPKRQ
ncbi:MAG: NAD(P)-dependent oxidoreductase [Spirochaetales bacterium]|nr:NAD(P)-dependent oxidoreductase [Spirochaetales bacterium]